MRTKRKIIRIDEDKCDGCGLCVPSCAEGAIAIVEGKARLVKESYCDGLGACLGECPRGALTIEERETEEFDEPATKSHERRSGKKDKSLPCGCPGTLSQSFAPQPPTETSVQKASPSQLANWPVQLKLVPPDAPYLRGAELLLVADCVPFSLADFHGRILKGKPVVVGCPKLDDGDFYTKKLSEILQNSSPKSLTVVHMEVPCCSGLVRIAEAALALSDKEIPFKELTVSIRGEILNEE